MIETSTWCGIPYISDKPEYESNIAKYLGLDSLLQTIVAESDVFSKEVSSTINSTVCLLIITLSSKEFLYLVQTMELNNSKEYPEHWSIYDVRKIQEKIENCVVSRLGPEIKIIYDIYLIFLLDTKCMRRLFEETDDYLLKSIFQSFKDEFEKKLTESGYFAIYFESGKRYFTKRNNIKFRTRIRKLLKNFTVFVGKLMVGIKKKRLDNHLI